MSQHNKLNHIHQTLRRYFQRVMPLKLPLIEAPMDQLNQLMQWDMPLLSDEEYRRRM